MLFCVTGPRSPEIESLSSRHAMPRGPYSHIRILASPPATSLLRQRRLNGALELFKRQRAHHRLPIDEKGGRPPHPGCLPVRKVLCHFGRILPGVKTKVELLGVKAELRGPRFQILDAELRLTAENKIMIEPELPLLVCALPPPPARCSLPSGIGGCVAW